MSETEMKDTKIYELAYLLVPTIPEENVAAEGGNLKEEISSLGAMIISEEYPKFIPLAYEMQKTIANKKEKFNSGYFGWVKFELEAEGSLKLKEMIERKENIIRFMIIKTVRENTRAPSRPRVAEGRRQYVKKEERSERAKAVEINKEEVDKKIEEMVAAA